MPLFSVQQMNPIHFCHVIDGSNHNLLLYNSIKYSDRAKFEYTVVSLEPENGLQEQMAELGVRSFSMNYLSRRQAFSTLIKLYRFFRRERMQIVQTHLFDASLIGLAAARLAGVPVTIFTGHHSHETPLHRRKLLTFIDGLSGRFLSKHTIAPSHQMKDIFIRDLHVPHEKIEVVHHGFDIEELRRLSPQVTGIREEFGLGDKIIFGAVGRLFWVKAFDVLIDAFAAATADRSDAVLLIVGGGDQAGLRRKIESCGLEKKIILMGRREDIYSVIADFDVFIHSSLAESFGMVLVEALALGKPVISTKVGIAAETIRDGVNGFLADAGDMDSLSKSIKNMLSVREKWPEMGAVNAEITEKFAVSKTQSICDELYLKWLNQK